MITLDIDGYAMVEMSVEEKFVTKMISSVFRARPHQRYRAADFDRHVESYQPLGGS